MNTKLKLAMLVSGMVFGVSGVAFAATGQLPDAVKSGVAAITGSFSGAGDQGTPATATTSQYGNHDAGSGAAGDQYAPGEPGRGDKGKVEAELRAAMNQYGEDGASMVARDKDATGTMTLPDGNEVENHGIAVSGAAHEQGDGDVTPPASTTAAPAMSAPAPRGDEEDAPSPSGTVTTQMSSGGSGSGSGSMGGER